MGQQNKFLSKFNQVLIITLYSKKNSEEIWKQKLRMLGIALPGRVNSIDFFRGLTMFLLAGESHRTL